MTSELLIGVLLVVGAAFMLLAALGMWRFPDVFTRMQSATKAGTLGVSCMLAAVAVARGGPGIVAGVGLIVLFLLLTAPTAAHRLGRAAYRVGVPLWEGTHHDDLKDALAAEEEPRA
jgi:multicomponent Na+:H+ antiporter subunit G